MSNDNPMQIHDDPDSESTATRRLFSRVIVILMVLWIGGFGLTALYQSLRDHPPGERVVSPFKPWDGAWVGEIIVTDSTGAVLRRTAQRREYRHVLADKDFRQEGHFRTLGDGPDAGELERQLNTMDFEFRVLRRKAMRRNGTQTIDYAGEVKDGRLVWSHNVPGGSFVLTEWVEGDEIHVEGTETAGEPGSAQTLTISGLFRRESPVASSTPD